MNSREMLESMSAVELKRAILEAVEVSDARGYETYPERAKKSKEEV